MVNFKTIENKLVIYSKHFYAGIGNRKIFCITHYDTDIGCNFCIAFIISTLFKILFFGTHIGGRLEVEIENISPLLKSLPYKIIYLAHAHVTFYIS